MARRALPWWVMVNNAPVVEARAIDSAAVVLKIFLALEVVQFPDKVDALPTTKPRKRFVMPTDGNIPVTKAFLAEEGVETATLVLKPTQIIPNVRLLFL